MADERLRALRRRVSTDPDARERWIRERHRAGQLDAARVRLAAFLGDPLALALQGSAPAVPDAFADWAQLLTGFGRPVFVRAARVAAGLRAAPDEAERASVLRLVEAWLEEPSDDTAQALAPFGRSPGPTASPAMNLAASISLRSLSAAAEAAVLAVVPYQEHSTGVCATCGVVHEEVRHEPGQDADLNGRLRRAITDALVAWALDEGAGDVEGPAVARPIPDLWPGEEPAVPVPEVPIPASARKRLAAALAKPRSLRASRVPAGERAPLAQAIVAAVQEHPEALTLVASLERLVEGAEWSVERLAWTLVLMARTEGVRRATAPLLRAALDLAAAGPVPAVLRAGVELHVARVGGEHVVLAAPALNREIEAILGPAEGRLQPPAVPSSP